MAATSPKTSRRGAFGRLARRAAVMGCGLYTAGFPAGLDAEDLPWQAQWIVSADAGTAANTWQAYRSEIFLETIPGNGRECAPQRSRPGACNERERRSGSRARSLRSRARIRHA